MSKERSAKNTNQGGMHERYFLVVHDSLKTRSQEIVVVTFLLRESGFTAYVYGYVICVFQAKFKKIML